MKRMASSNVFLSGLGGLGIEIGNIENVAYIMEINYLYLQLKT